MMRCAHQRQQTANSGSYQRPDPHSHPETHPAPYPIAVAGCWLLIADR
jgi:hypothetical protein